jgi:hypothetical protein
MLGIVPKGYMFGRMLFPKWRGWIQVLFCFLYRKSSYKGCDVVVSFGVNWDKYNLVRDGESWIGFFNALAHQWYFLYFR